MRLNITSFMNKKRLKAFVRLVLRKHREPEAIARGAGLGILIAFLPLIGLQAPVALVLASFFKVNRIAAVIGTLLSNPVTAMPQAVFSIWLGSALSSGEPIDLAEIRSLKTEDMLHLSGDLLQSYLLGTTFLAIVGGFVTYLTVRLILMALRSRQHHR